MSGAPELTPLDDEGPALLIPGCPVATLGRNRILSNCTKNYILSDRFTSERSALSETEALLSIAKTVYQTKTLFFPVTPLSPNKVPVYILNSFTRHKLSPLHPHWVRPSLLVAYPFWLSCTFPLIHKNPLWAMLSGNITWFLLITFLTSGVRGLPPLREVTAPVWLSTQTWSKCPPWPHLPSIKGESVQRWELN